MSGLGKKVRRQALVRAARARKRAAPMPGAPLGLHVALVEQDIVRAVTSTTREDVGADDHVDD